MLIFAGKFVSIVQQMEQKYGVKSQFTFCAKNTALWIANFFFTESMKKCLPWLVDGIGRVKIKILLHSLLQCGTYSKSKTL